MHAVIFDLDGVLVSTDALHAEAWGRAAREVGVQPPAGVGDLVRGVSRMESAEIVLRASARAFSEAERAAFAERKNEIYQSMLQGLDPGGVLPGALELLGRLRDAGAVLGLASGSRNAREILERTGLTAWFAAVVDGHDLTRSKPDPQVFEIAMRRLGVVAEQTVIVEDAPAGIEAGRRAGARTVGLGPATRDAGPDLWAESIEGVSASAVLGLLG